jgi:hypothetical protein
MDKVNEQWRIVAYLDNVQARPICHIPVLAGTMFLNLLCCTIDLPDSKWKSSNSTRVTHSYDC